MKIPSDGKWIQGNGSTVRGSLYGTKGVDLTSNIGVLRSSPRLLVNTSSSDDADLGIPVAFEYYDSRWWSVAGAVLFKQSLGGGAAGESFTQDATSGTPTNLSSNISDMGKFAGSLYVTSASTSVYKYGDVSWSNFAISGSGTSDTKILCKYADRMYMTYGAGCYRVTSWDSSDVVATMGSSNTLTLGGSRLRITFMETAPSGIWIGTISTENGNCSIFFWNGEQTTPNAEYVISSKGVLAGYVDGGVLYAIDADGHLQAFNGAGFTDVARLPVPDDLYIVAPLDADPTDRFIHFNGLTVDNGVVRALINGRIFENAQRTLENLPSGVWEYSKGTNWYNKHLPSYTGIGTTTITDYGQTRIRAVGALASAKSISSSTSTGTLLAGIQYHYDGTTATRNAIFIDDNGETVQKYSYAIFPEILSSSFTEMWQKAVPRFKKLASSSDSIVVKHRVGISEPVQISLTWVDTSSFTTTTDVSAYVGWEVEVLNGTGGGKCAHIVSVSGSGTYTVTLDDTFTGVTTGTAVANINRWIKDGSYSSTADNFAEFTISDPATVISVKLCAQTTGKWDLYDMFLTSDADKLAQ